MKRIITVLALILTIGIAQGQNGYYICPADSVGTYSPDPNTGWMELMAQSLGNENVSPRWNIAQDQAVLKFTDALAPDGSGIKYDQSEINIILNTEQWDTTAPEAIDSTARISLARQYGVQLTNRWFQQVDDRLADGAWTPIESYNAYSDYEDLLNLTNNGVFDLVVAMDDAGLFPPQGVVTTQMVNQIIVRIELWITDHPRSTP